MTATRKPSAKKLAKLIAVAQKEENRAGQLMAKELFTVKEKAFKTTKAGYISRVEDKEHPVDRAEVAQFLKYRRAFGIEECLEEIGEAWLKAMIDRKYVIANEAGTINKDGFQTGGYFVSMKAVETYNLPVRDQQGRKIAFIEQNWWKRQQRAA